MLSAEKHIIIFFSVNGLGQELAFSGMLITSHLHLSSHFSSVCFYFGNRGPGRHTELKSTKYQQDLGFMFASFYIRIIYVRMLLDLKSLTGITFSLMSVGLE